MTARPAAPGLGLALVRGLAELHGGRAWIESEEGAGCTAFVVLPVQGIRAVAAVRRLKRKRREPKSAPCFPPVRKIRPNNTS